MARRGNRTSQDDRSALMENLDPREKAGLGSKRLLQISPWLLKGSVNLRLYQWQPFSCSVSATPMVVKYVSQPWMAVPTITSHSVRGNQSCDITLTLQHKSSSSSRGPLVLEAARSPVQHMPRLLSDITQGLACSGSCSLLLALGRPLSPLSGGLLCWVGVLCSHSETQEATEMLLQEFERLCSFGWLLAGGS